MKYTKLFIIPFVSLLICSCEDKGISLGAVDYYPSFLWVEANMTPVTKTIDFDFSEDAKNDQASFAEFQFVDNEGKPISTSIMQVEINGKQIENNTFKVYSNVSSLDLKISFSPEASEGKYQGYLKLINHKLDRLDSQPLTSGQQIDAFQWTLHYDKRMNPLAKVLMWIGILVGLVLLLWFRLLRPCLYPHFGSFTKSILIQKNDQIVGQLRYTFKGARKVVFYDKEVKQSIWNRIFTGKIKTYVNPLFKTKLTFSPRKKNASAYGIEYVITPNPIPRNGVATITNITEKLIITLS